MDCDALEDDECAPSRGVNVNIVIARRLETGACAGGPGPAYSRRARNRAK